MTSQRCCTSCKNVEQLILAVTGRVDGTRPLTELLEIVVQPNKMAQRTSGNVDLLTFGSRCCAVQGVGTPENIGDVIFLYLT